MKYSCIITTIENRFEALLNCLRSIDEAVIKNQCAEQVEVLVVMQGGASAQKQENFHFKTIFLTNPDNSLSHARNLGIQNSHGDYLCFIDDDATVGEDFFTVMGNEIVAHHPRVMCGRILDMQTGAPLLKHFQDVKPRSLGIYDMRYFMGSSHVIAKTVFNKYGLLDERFGVGSRFGACEESEYFFRLLNNQETVAYVPQLIYYHPEIKKVSQQKVYSYSYALGVLLALYSFKVNRFSFDYIWLFLDIIIKNFIRSIVNVFARNYENLNLSVLNGVVVGYFVCLFKNILLKKRLLK